jgi:cytoskeletal protein CcmA (bactofilin family)
MKKSGDQINAFLGKETEFEGKLAFEGAVRIDGRLKGEILSEGTLIVGETADVESDIKVGEIFISGKVSGNIAARNRIEIRAPGKVFGNIRAPIVVINEGVIFEGNCRMQKGEERADQKVARLGQEATPKNQI